MGVIAVSYLQGSVTPKRKYTLKKQSYLYLAECIRTTLT
jgi:hypothetical protein